MGKDSICRLYVGHIPPMAKDEEVLSFFAQAGINRTAITLVLKRGYGFLECRDQATADICIERLNGRNYKGFVLIVEPANPPQTVLPPRRNYGHASEPDRRGRPYAGPATPTARTALDLLFHSAMNVQGEPETTFLYVPSQAVGGIIGSKGATIRHYNWASGASLKIATADETGSRNERRITIYGPVDSHWKAQSLIFDKISDTLPFNGSSLRLHMEMYVPNDCVGRLIGKGGQRIQEIQLATGAKFKFLTAQESGGRTINGKTILQIYGDYPQLYHAQARIRLGVSNILRDVVGKQSREQKEQNESGELTV